MDEHVCELIVLVVLRELMCGVQGQVVAEIRTPHTEAVSVFSPRTNRWCTFHFTSKQNAVCRRRS